MKLCFVVSIRISFHDNQIPNITVRNPSLGICSKYHFYLAPTTVGFISAGYKIIIQSANIGAELSRILMIGGWITYVRLATSSSFPNFGKHHVE
ncbi:MAG: hypothetical protein EOP48_16340 [Sphingobacteriales bacterium]|nr:MAG: hypothetical protein EOP48_16340 [Sphingobacteriales bacterium]